MPIQRLHRRLRAPGFTGPGQHRPALRNRVDRAFLIDRGSERRAIVKPGAAIPGAVPGVPLEIAPQLPGFQTAAAGEGRIAVKLGKRGERRQHLVQEEPQPDAFTLAVDADQVHAVVPVAGTHQRQAVHAESQPVQDRPHAVLVQARRFRRTPGQVVVRLLLGTERAVIEEVRSLVEHASVAGAEHVTAGRQRQP